MGSSGSRALETQEDKEMDAVGPEVMTTAALVPSSVASVQVLHLTSPLPADHHARAPPGLYRGRSLDETVVVDLQSLCEGTGSGARGGGTGLGRREYQR